MLGMHAFEILNFICSFSIFFLYSIFSPNSSLSSPFPPQSISSHRHLIKIVFLSGIFSIFAVAGGTLLRYISVPFNQAIGATIPFFTVVFALAFTCRREQPLVYLSLLVVLSLVFASNSEPLFHLFGFLVYLASTVGRALKPVVKGILYFDNEKLNSMSLQT